MTGTVLASGLLFSGALVLSGTSPSAASSTTVGRELFGWAALLGAMPGRHRRARRRAAHAARGRHAAGPPTLLPHDYTRKVPLPR